MAIIGVKISSLHRHSVFKYKPIFRNKITHCVLQISRLYTQGLTENISHTSRVDNHFLKKKFDDLVLWYEQLTGMEEVRLAQNRVIDAQSRFVRAQEKRREISKELSLIQGKLKELYAELDSTTRGEERYLQLITQEHNILKKEKQVLEEFTLSEREERDCFTALSSAVKESHEKERAQAERTKYWSVIGSIIGTVIGVAGSSINNEFKMRELRNLVKESAARSVENSEADNVAASILSRHEEQLSTIVSEMKSIAGRTDNTRAGQLLHNLSSTEPEAVVNSDLEAMIRQQRNEMRAILITSAVISITVPLIVGYFNRL